MGLFCKQLPCWSSEWAVLRSSIFVSGVPCAKPKSTKAYLKRQKFRTRSHKVSINHSIYCSLLIYLSFTFHSVLLMCTVASITVLFSSFSSYIPILPIPSMFLPYTTVHCFLSQNLFKCMLSPKVLKKYFQQLLFEVPLMLELWIFSQQSRTSGLTLAGFPWAEDKGSSEDRQDQQCLQLWQTSGKYYWNLL